MKQRMEHYSRIRLPTMAYAIFTLLALFEDNNAYATTKISEDFGVSNHIGYNVGEGRRIDAEKTQFNHSRLILNENEGLDNEKTARQCNIFKGKWVHDTSYPLYYEPQCPYIGGQVKCRSNGRPDSDYEKWRWKPYGCTIPRFNAIQMLERLRGKRLMFVGDSTDRNQWQSMVCLLNAVIPSNRKSMVYGTPLTMFKALDYRASVEFFWAPFLVELDVNNQGKIILRLDAIDKYGAYWRGVDILVFESAHWWTHSGREKSWDVIMEGNRIYRDMDPMVAYKKGLTTWANWISSNLDPRRSLVFFRSISAKHYSPSEWKEANGHKCYNEREPIKIRGYRPPVPSQVPIVKQVLKTVRFPVVLLDITLLSEYRKDGHPSVFSSDINAAQRHDPDSFADCSHWCLPGVPDTWNELLYASLL